MNKEQMFTDEFIGEVIQIVAPTRIHIDIYERGDVGPENVRVRFDGKSVNRWKFSSDQRVGQLAKRSVRCVKS